MLTQTEKYVWIVYCIGKELICFINFQGSLLKSPLTFTLISSLYKVLPLNSIIRWWNKLNWHYHERISFSSVMPRYNISKLWERKGRKGSLTLSQKRKWRWIRHTLRLNPISFSVKPFEREEMRIRDKSEKLYIRPFFKWPTLTIPSIKKKKTMCHSINCLLKIPHR